MKSDLATILLLLSLLPLHGCGSSESTMPTSSLYSHFLIGTWTEERGRTTLVFSDNNRYLEKRQGRLGSGTWQLDDTTLHINLTRFTLNGVAVQGLRGSYSLSVSIRGITMNATMDCSTVQIQVADESVPNAQATAASILAAMRSDCQAGPEGILIKQL